MALNQKVKTDKDIVKEAIKAYIIREGYKKKNVKNPLIPSKRNLFDMCLGCNILELLYQNRLHTFGKNRITWAGFKDKCNHIFTLGYVYDKHTKYEISLFKINDLYKTIKYLAVYKKTTTNKSDTIEDEYKVFSIKDIYSDHGWEKFFKGE